MSEFATQGVMPAERRNPAGHARLTPPDAPPWQADGAGPPPMVSPLLLLDTIRRRMLSIAATTLALGAAGLALVTDQPPHYLAIASVMVEDHKPSVGSLPASVRPLGSDGIAVRTQVDLLRSEAMTAGVVNRLDLVHAAEFTRLIDPPPNWWRSYLSTWWRALGLDIRGNDAAGQARVQRAASILRSKTAFANDGRTYMVDIQVRTENPALGAAIANAYAEDYLTLKTRLKADALRRAGARFAARLTELREQMSRAEAAVQSYRAQAGLIEDRAAAPTAGVTLASQQMAEVNAQLVAVGNERARLEATLAQLRRAPRGAIRAGDLASLPDVVASPLIQRLHEQQAELAARAANLAATHGANAPDLLSLRAALLDIDDKIATEVGRVGASLTSAAQAAQTRETLLRNTLTTLQAQVAAEGNASVHLLELQSEAAAARAIYSSVLDRVQQTGTDLDLQEPDAVLVSAASPASEPAFPTRRQLALLDLAGAPVLALLVALLRDRLRPGLRSPEALERLSGLPCLSFLPRRRGRRGAREFAAALSGLSALLGPRRPRVLLLTAAVPREGTSMLAGALARTVAEAGERVLLVICGRGIAPPFLPMPNLEVTYAMPPALPEAQHNRYDLILLDTPPVLSAGTTLPLAGLQGVSTILVVRFGHTPAPIIARAVHLLRRHGAQLAGTVVTEVARSELSARDGVELYIARHRRTRRAGGQRAVAASWK